jgi:hypothetical protein
MAVPSSNGFTGRGCWEAAPLAKTRVSHRGFLAGEVKVSSTSCASSAEWRAGSTPLRGDTRALPHKWRRRRGPARHLLRA